MKAEVIQAAEYQRERATKIIEWLSENAEEITRVEQGLLPVQPQFINATIDITNKSIDLSYSGGKLVLTGIFAAFRKLGYEPTTRPADEKLSSFSCYWDHPTEELRFWLSFSSTMCKRVKVGTKMVEQPVYETVCDE